MGSRSNDVIVWHPFPQVHRVGSEKQSISTFRCVHWCFKCWLGFLSAITQARISMPHSVSNCFSAYFLLAICSVFLQFVNVLLSLDCHRLVIYSDSTNSVDIFNSLWAINAYNCILISAVNIVLDHDIDFWVLHVCGINNPIANALSRFNNDLAVSLCLGLVIWTFKPPQDALGAVTK